MEDKESIQLLEKYKNWADAKLITIASEKDPVKKSFWEGQKAACDTLIYIIDNPDR